MKLHLTVAIAVALALCACATTPKQSPADVAAARKAHMAEMGKYSKAVGDEAKNPTPDMAALQAAVDNLVAAGKGLDTWFAKGSGQGQGFETNAKAAIWTDAAGFKTAVTNFDAARQALAAARNSDAATIAAKVGALGAACGACHRSYRGKDT
jgi:cytochrome c556